MSYNNGTETNPKIIYDNNKDYYKDTFDYTLYNNFIDYEKKPFYAFKNAVGMDIIPKKIKLLLLI